MIGAHLQMGKDVKLIVVYAQRIGYCSKAIVFNLAAFIHFHVNIINQIFH